MSKYNKLSLSLDDQIELLKKRNLIIDDTKRVKAKLNFIGYYHLSAYFKSFQNQETDLFNKYVTFEQVLNLYNFDRKLKISCFDIIERVELSLKSLLNNVMAQKCGNNWFENSSYFIDKFNHQGALQKLKDKNDYLKSKDGFVKEFYNKYPKEKKLPPSWIFMEILSFGEAIMLFRNLKRKYRKKIAKYYEFDEKIIISWFELINDIRNICAHHGRLWNRNLKKVFIPKVIENFPSVGNMFSALLVFSYLLSILSPNSELIPNIIKLMKESDIDLNKMGCNENWENILLKSKIKNPPADSSLLKTT